MSQLQHWERTGSRQVADCRVFTVRADDRISPRTGNHHTFYVIEGRDWVNIIPITPDGQYVFVRQFRHGTAEISLEIPGGIIDPEDPDPLTAARREMREETGYDTAALEDLTYLGPIAPNPAIQNNRCHMFVAHGVTKVGELMLDGAEDIEVVLIDPADVPRLVREGVISHALAVVAFYLYEHQPTAA
ncbi:MAG: NUDIX hydrolase [Bacteroidota bacterium]